jgi:CheY-like chemotaxis protein
MLRRLVPENIEIEFIPGTNQAFIKADATQVEQVVMNLVINARDAMPDGGRVRIETADCVSGGNEVRSPHKPATNVMIAVKDSGFGMNEATKAQIFEPFFTTKEAGKGTGLGLAIVFDIVKQSGGQIFVESEVGRGTTFTIDFPRAERVSQQNIIGKVETLCQATETILLVEDERTVRESIAEYLRQNGYHALAASGGPQALAIARQFTAPIHLMLTDVIMPLMSGRVLAEEIANIHPETKVVFMSGYSDNLLSNRQVLDPDCVLLQKPIRLALLGSRLRELLGPVRSHVEPTMQSHCRETL